MEPKKYSKIFATLLLSISLAGCSLLPVRTVTETVYVSRDIPIQPRPQPVNLFPVKFYAVSESNIEEFRERFVRENGELTFIALSVPHYENLSLNVAELRRYILQQQTLLLFYENSIREDDE